MTYVLAIFLPPLAIIAAGRFASGLLLGVVWFFVAVMFPPTHILFVIVAWVMIAQARSDRRHRQLLKAMAAR